MTPMQVAAGYTAFANGVRAEPMFLRSVVDADGSLLEHNEPHTHPVLDPRVTYLVTSVLEDVINQGTERPFARRIYRPGRGEDGHFARRLVRGIYIEFALRGVGGVR